MRISDVAHAARQLLRCNEVHGAKSVEGQRRLSAPSLWISNSCLQCPSFPPCRGAAAMMRRTMTNPRIGGAVGARGSGGAKFTTKCDDENDEGDTSRVTLPYPKVSPLKCHLGT